MYWNTSPDSDVVKLEINPFILQAFPAGNGYSYKILVASEDKRKVVVVVTCSDTYDELRDAKDAAFGKLDEILTEIRGWIDHHLERRWREETGWRHAD